MKVVGQLVLLTGLLMAANSDVRARDPEVELDDPGETLAQDGPRVPSGGTSSWQMGTSRTGNWCAFVYQRLVTVSLACGTEKYTIKSQSPCPSGTPDCQLIMYKLSTRPVYRQKKKVFTALQWRCCPGHTGRNCDESVADDQISNLKATGEEEQNPGGAQAQPHHPGAQVQDQHWEQNDFEVSGSPLYEARGAQEDNTSSIDLTYDYEHSPPQGHDHRQHGHSDDGQGAVSIGETPLSFHPSTGFLQHVTAVLMSQVQPVLDGFNRTLERLAVEVQGLSQDVKQLQLRQELEDHDSLRHGGEEETEQAYLDGKIKETVQQIDIMKRLMTSQHNQLEEKLHSQHAMLHHNLTNFKTDIDFKLDRNQKTLQIELQSLNSSLVELKQGQEHLEEELQRVVELEGTDQHLPLLNGDSVVWEAITRLDNKVVNNTVDLTALTEEQQLMNGNINDLQKGFRHMEEQIDKTRRKSQIQFMETGLEVEAAKVAVLQSVNQLGQNITKHADMLHELEMDVDYLFEHFHKNFSSLCDCGTLRNSVLKLGNAVENVTELANENRLAIEGGLDIGQDRWKDWEPLVEDLQDGLMEVRKALAFEKEQNRALTLNVSLLQTSLLSNQQNLRQLQLKADDKVLEMGRLASSFESLLKDAIRHSDVLEIILGEEVLVFLERPMDEQNEYAISDLMKKVNTLKEQLDGQGLTVTSLLQASQADVSEVADEPSVLSDWALTGLRKSRDPQYHLSEEYSDNDFWTLRKVVDELEARVTKSEAKPCPGTCTTDAASGGEGVDLHSEVAFLRRGLEDHLKLFRKIFRYTEDLAGSEATVDLDKLLELLRRNKVKERNRQAKKHSQSEAKTRSKKDASLETGTPSYSQLAFVYRAQNTTHLGDVMIFEEMVLDRGQMYCPKTGVFKAPTKGIYLFIVTLETRPGPFLVNLRREKVVETSLSQGLRRSGGTVSRVCLLELEQGEHLHLELAQGALELSRPHDNTFVGLLLYQTT
ncbi:multimerin-2a [Denticeps clupeoides]|uniref:Multimerin-2 n=1 Tax=Denticeps clupeoides TaxID=299321 RepID=A0AAY4BYN3_9TELE|nr:multimerin-2 [Denticeps clupeoides]